METSAEVCVAMTTKDRKANLKRVFKQLEDSDCALTAHQKVVIMLAMDVIL